MIRAVVGFNMRSLEDRARRHGQGGPALRSAAEQWTLAGMSAGAAEHDGLRWLRHYVHDHYLASRGGLELFQRSARTQRDPQVRDELVAMTAEVAEDRAALLSILDELAVPRSPLQEHLVAAAERVGRLKLNGTLLRRSPLTDLVELEALTVAVHAKQLGWLCLRDVSETVTLLNPLYLDRLAERAGDQEARLGRLRIEVARTVFSSDPPEGSPS